MKLIGFVKLLVVIPLLLNFSCGGGGVSSVFDNAAIEYNEEANHVEFTVNLNSDSNFEMEVLLPVQQFLYLALSEFQLMGFPACQV